MSEWEHVILLSADALRADHLSCYGYQRTTSPVLDDLAAESLRFTRAYSASSHTREAVPALLTGEYPDVAVDENYRLATETVATTLSEEGFATGGFHSNPFVSRAYGFDRGFDTFDDDLHLGQHRLVALAQRALDKLRNRHYARATEINERSLDWIDSLAEGQPFFLWNHYMDTHGPYEPPAEYARTYLDRPVSDKDAQSLYQRAIADPDSITDDEREQLIDLYDAEIRYNDAQIGAFLDALRERDVLERSLVIVTADHGDAFGEHGYYEHPRYLHEELTHVPLLVRPPGGTGEVVSTPVSTLDIVATIEDELEMEIPSERASLLDPPAGERSVFQQARREDEDAHLRRYALRAETGSCFCERDRQTDAVEFVGATERSLRSALDSHVERRIRRENGTQSEASATADDEIERRLSALGYKE
ncbi:sulfatase [Halococcus salifodinae]|uniref:Sulfatase n=1 Tax=Halococcus salifodinae DSM 8989 TaxID=1227456 RepID=M0N4V1_9EURY|nr:sulfatase [Halococcus salifodinae]EMA51725.1 sulfatase [Halococcus salifodinae DSM 8989]